MAEIENVVIIDRFDYDELIEKARMTDEEIKKEAERIFMQENGVLVRIKFNEYYNSKNFTAPIGFIRGGEKEDIYKILIGIYPTENSRLKAIREESR